MELTLNLAMETLFAQEEFLTKKEPQEPKGAQNPWMLGLSIFN